MLISNYIFLYSRYRLQKIPCRASFTFFCSCISAADLHCPNILVPQSIMWRMCGECGACGCDDVMMWYLLEKENVASVVWGKDRKGGNGWVDGIWWKLWKFSWIFPSILHWFLSALHTFQKACHIAAHVARRHWHRIRAHHPVKLLKNFERRGGEMSVFFFMRKLCLQLGLDHSWWTLVFQQSAWKTKNAWKTRFTSRRLHAVIQLLHSCFTIDSA